MKTKKIIERTKSRWMEGGGNLGDVVISSRIRLARNLEGYPFPLALTESRADTVLEEVSKAIALAPDENYDFLNLREVPQLERYILVEKHLISPQHAENPVGKGVAIKEDQSVSIMVNEEDHLRIQCLLPGLALEDAWSSASKADDVLENTLDIAFSEKNGYLTSCPTNVGTGLRASAMLHLPALVMTSQVNRVLGLLPQLGLAVRGLYGEGSEAMGNLFQISNQVTLGKTEEDILANLSAVAKQIVDKEREARQGLLREAREQLEDRVWRAFGLLSNARLLSGQESLALLSDLRLGLDLNLLSKGSPDIFCELMVITGSAHLQYIAGQEISTVARDMERAKVVRTRMSSLV